EKEDPVIVTKSLANDYDVFIAKLSSDVHISHGSTIRVDPKVHAGENHGATKVWSQPEDVGRVKPISFAFVLQNKTSKKTVVVSELHNDERVKSAAVVIPMEVVKEVSSAFDNTYVVRVFHWKTPCASSCGELREEHLG
ncbi:hypothetical protein Tco_0663216, partial [Tanacetum coccineum]